MIQTYTWNKISTRDCLRTIADAGSLFALEMLNMSFSFFSSSISFMIRFAFSDFSGFAQANCTFEASIRRSSAFRLQNHAIVCFSHTVEDSDYP